MTRRRYELTETEWEIIEPLLPNKPRGVPRVDDRRVINGILWRFSSAASPRSTVAGTVAQLLRHPLNLRRQVPPVGRGESVYLGLQSRRLPFPTEGAVAGVAGGRIELSHQAAKRRRHVRV